MALLLAVWVPFSGEDVEMPMSCLLPKGRQWMAEAELKNGRTAMMACLGIGIFELSTKARPLFGVTLEA